MAWTAPMTAVDNAMYTAAQFNTHVRDNLLETMPGKATTPGSYFVSNGPNSINERFPYTATVATADTTNSTTFTDLNTPGPSLTIAAESAFFIFISANMIGSTSSSFALMSVDLSGANNIGPADGLSLGAQGNVNRQMGHIFRYTNQPGGTYTFTAKYRVTSGSATFSNRSISVLAL